MAKSPKLNLGRDHSAATQQKKTVTLPNGDGVMRKGTKLADRRMRENALVDNSLGDTLGPKEILPAFLGKMKEVEMEDSLTSVDVAPAPIRQRRLLLDDDSNDETLHAAPSKQTRRCLDPAAVADAPRQSRREPNVEEGKLNMGQPSPSAKRGKATARPRHSKPKDVASVKAKQSKPKQKKDKKGSLKEPSMYSSRECTPC
ncbi:unnamed protein product [Linum trigynum]|uniref:Uncharacterized protein n=1 Tax=Linum trigynum TaxID=586398 RepID=A0AAV2F6L2_9ROSI